MQLEGEFFSVPALSPTIFYPVSTDADPFSQPIHPAGVSFTNSSVFGPAFSEQPGRFLFPREVVVVAIDTDAAHAWLVNEPSFNAEWARGLPVLEEQQLGAAFVAKNHANVAGPHVGQPVQAFNGNVPFGNPSGSMHALAGHLLTLGKFPGHANTASSVSSSVSQFLTPRHGKPSDSELKQFLTKEGKSILLSFKRLTAAEAGKVGFNAPPDTSTLLLPLTGERYEEIKSAKHTTYNILSVPELAVTFAAIPGDKVPNLRDCGANEPSPIMAPNSISSHFPQTSVYAARDLHSACFLRNTFFISPKKQWVMNTAEEGWTPKDNENWLYEWFPASETIHEDHHTHANIDLGKDDGKYLEEFSHSQAHTHHRSFRLPTLLGILVWIPFTWHSTRKIFDSGSSTRLNIPTSAPSSVRGDFVSGQKRFQLRHFAWASTQPLSTFGQGSVHYTGCTPNRNGHKEDWYYDKRPLIKLLTQKTGSEGKFINKLSVLTIEPDGTWGTLNSTPGPLLFRKISAIMKQFPDIMDSSCPDPVLANARDMLGVFLNDIYVFVCDFKTWKTGRPSDYKLPSGSLRQFDLMALRLVPHGPAPPRMGGHQPLPRLSGTLGKDLELISVTCHGAYLVFTSGGPGKSLDILKTATPNRGAKSHTLGHGDVHGDAPYPWVQTPNMLHALQMATLTPFGTWGSPREVQHNDEDGTVYDPRFQPGHNVKLNAGMSWADSSAAHSQRDVTDAARRKRGGDHVCGTLGTTTICFPDVFQAGIHIMRCLKEAESSSLAAQRAHSIQVAMSQKSKGYGMEWKVKKS